MVYGRRLPHGRRDAVRKHGKRDAVRKKPLLHRRAIAVPGVCLAFEILTYLLALYLRESDNRTALREDAAALADKMPGNLQLLAKILGRKALVVGRLFLNHAEDICNPLITVAAITAAIVVLFYTLIDARNFGVPHRTIMYYFLGSFTLPLEFLLLMFKLPLIYIFAYGEDWNAFAAVLEASSIVQQFLIILMIVLSTSRTFDRLMITFEERWQYSHRKNLTDGGRKYYAAWEASHAMLAARSEEMFSDRARLVQGLLNVPRWYVKKYKRKTYRRDKLSWECIGIYDYYFEQASGIFSVLEGDREREKEREKFYQLLYIFLTGLREDTFWRKLAAEPKYGVQYRYFFHVVSGAFMNAALQSEVKEQHGFCNYILNEIFQDGRERNRQISFYILMIFAYHYINGGPVFPGTAEGNGGMDTVAEHFLQEDRSLGFLVEGGLAGVRGFESWRIEPEDEDFCERCWYLLIRNTTADMENAEQYYSDIIEMMLECSEQNRLLHGGEDLEE